MSDEKRISLRTVIFGGSFDPVHRGHLLVATEVLDRFDYQRVVFVPASLSPHKDEAPSAGDGHRVEMLRLALGSELRFEIDEFEIEKGGTSFTVDTVRHLIQSGSVAGTPGLIIGADLASAFETWKEVGEVERLTDIILVRRPGYEGAGLRRRHLTMENPQLEVSSSELRRLIATGGSYRHWLPESVAQYIELNGLYR